MCGSLLSKFKRNNKVAPDPFTQELLKKAQRLRDEENAHLKNNVLTQNGPSLVSPRPQDVKNDGPAWLAYDLSIDGSVLHKGLTIKCPRKLVKDSSLPVLTREMLLEKQAQAEKNRNKQLERRRKAAIKSVEVKQRKEEDESLNRAAQLAQKQTNAAENRAAQLERVKSRASKSSNTTRSESAEAQHVAKTNQMIQQCERKVNIAQANRERAVEAVVTRQRQRAAHAQKLRQRLVKQQQEEDEMVQYMLADMETDPNFNVSDSEHDEGMWDDDNG